MAMITKKQQAINDRNEAINKLRDWLPPGSTVNTILRSCSRSGMTRHISLVATVDGQLMDITWLAARAMDDRIKNGAIVVGGCGMDMGFSLVYNLGRTLYPKGFKLDPKQHGRNGDTSGHDTDGGYSLHHRWL